MRLHRIGRREQVVVRKIRIKRVWGDENPLNAAETESTRRKRA